MRIALSGPTGSGKTILARALGARLGISVADEDYKELMAGEEAYRRARYKRVESEATFVEAVRRNANDYIRWINRREDFLNSTTSYVADRWEADLLSNWITQVGRMFKDDEKTDFIINKMKKRSNDMTAVVLLPLSVPSRDLRHESTKLERNMTKSIRLCEYLLTRGLIENLTNVNCIYIPEKNMSVNERTDFVLEVLEDLTENVIGST